MKKIKIILPLLTILFLMIPGVSANAEPRIVKLTAGAETGKITFRVWDLQALEGTVKVKALDGGEIHLESISATTDGKAVVECSKNKVFMVSDGTPVKTTITINLSFVEDGTYLVTLSGGCTNKKGKYSSSGLYEEQEILVGAANVEEEEAETAETASATASENSTQLASGQTDSKAPKKEEATEGDEVTLVREETKESERVIDEILEEAEEAFEEVVKEEKTSKPKSSSNLWRILKIVLLVLFIILLAVAAYLIYRYRKKRKQDYDGAPDIDYVIEEDD